jgi:hypothetical protein
MTTFRAIGSHHLWQALHVAAAAAIAAGDAPAALAFAEEASRRVEELRAGLPSEGDHKSFEREAARVAATLASLRGT